MIVRLDTLVIIALNAAILATAMLIRQFYADSDIGTVLVIMSIAVMSLLVLHSYAWFNQGASDLSMAYVFFLMVFLFNLGKATLFMFFRDVPEPFFTFFNYYDLQIIVRAFEYSYCGFFVLSTAMLLSYKKVDTVQIEPTDAQWAAAKFTGLLFAAVSVPAAMMDLKDQVIAVLTGGYFALFSQEQSYGAAGIVKVLGFFMLPSLYILTIAFKKNKAIVYSIFIFCMLYALIRLAMGSRLASLIPVIVLLSLWDGTFKHVNRKMIYSLAAFAFAVVFPALALLRTGQSLDAHGESASAMFHILKEMSDSISPLIWVMQRVPWEMDFIYGHSFLLAVSTAIPNLFWDVHPAKAGSLALWLVNEVNPWIAERGGGYGFSIFAEMYLNFYWLGMPVLFLLGIFINKLATVRRNPINTAFCFACFLGIMLWPRGELVAVARFILWNVGIPWVCYHIMVFVFSKLRY